MTITPQMLGRGVGTALWLLFAVLIGYLISCAVAGSFAMAESTELSRLAGLITIWMVHTIEE